jgi:hypothetical protein
MPLAAPFVSIPKSQTDLDHRLKQTPAKCAKRLRNHDNGDLDTYVLIPSSVEVLVFAQKHRQPPPNVWPAEVEFSCKQDESDIQNLNDCNSGVLGDRLLFVGLVLFEANYQLKE